MTTLSKYDLSLRSSKNWLLWYKQSHSFSVVDTEFKGVIDAYFNDLNTEGFLNHLVDEGKSKHDAQDIVESIENYLEDCLYSKEEHQHTGVLLDTNARVETHYYRFRGLNFQVHFNALAVVPFFHSAIAHLEYSEKPQSVHAIFDIQIKDDHISLFLNEELIQCVPKTEYHKIQGKFNFCLLCKVYNKAETDWVATLHGCSIAKNNHTIMLIGNSGSGKSTASALLAAHGYQVLADDISALSAEDLHIYNNPSAISIKSGAFDLVSKYFKTLDHINSVLLHADKGQLRFLPSPPTSKTHYRCKAIVLLKYEAGAEIHFSKANLAEILEPLIPDSWISSEQKHVAAFMKWLESQQFYKLTYSDSADLVKTIDDLFLGFEVK
jgi:hypothetical protein